MTQSPPPTTLTQIYGLFKPLPEACVYAHISRYEKDGDFVIVHWQFSEVTAKWSMVDGVIIFEAIR